MSKSLGQQLFELQKEYRKLKNLPSTNSKWNQIPSSSQIDWRGYAKTPAGKADFIFYRQRIAMGQAVNFVNSYNKKKKYIRYLNRPNV